jgi:hypothetical protein
MRSTNLNAKTTLRQRLFRQLRAFAHTLIDSSLADELCDPCAEDVLGETGHPRGPLTTDCFPGGFDPMADDLPHLPERIRVARDALLRKAAERAAGLKYGDEPQAAHKSREYPMGLVPDYTSTMEKFRELIKVRTEEDGRKVVYLDPTEATPELLAALKGAVSSTVLVPAGSTVYVTGRPQVLFRPELVSIEGELAPFFSVVDIRIGKNSQFVSAAEILAEEFAPGRSRRMKFDTCQISMDVTVALRNRTDKPQRCPHVTLYGPAVE